MVLDEYLPEIRAAICFPLVSWATKSVSSPSIARRLSATAACSGGYDSFGFPCGGGGGSNGGGGSYQGAPGPLLAGGLPFLAVAGGAYWAVRRYRRKKK